MANSEVRANRVQMGLFLTNQQPLGSDLVAALHEQCALLRQAREAGWDSVWTGQHYLTETMAMLQPAPFLARLAAEAGEMRVGLGIMLLALQNPVEAAETVASLDVVCGGRFTWGVGLGYREVEYNAFGLQKRDLVTRFEQNLGVVQRLWSEDRVSVDLPWCRLDNVTLAIRPVQRPRPPLWFAANNDKAVQRAARLGDTWMINPHAMTSTIQRQLELFHQTRRAHDLPPPPELPAIREVICAPTRAEALELAGRYLAEKYRAYAAWGQDKVLPGSEKSFDRPYEELENDRFVVGTPEDCPRQLLPWRDHLGVDHFIFRCHWSGTPTAVALRTQELLTREVIPELRRGRPSPPAPLP